VPEDSVIDRLVEACNEPRDAAIIALLLNGLRASEVGSLETTDWTWSETYSCHIIRVLGKGFKERLVPANSQTSERVSRYLNGRQRASTWLLGPSQTTLRAIEYVLEKYCERAGIAGVSPHSLRHAYATRLARAHVGVFQLQQLLGHASPATTQRYITLDMGDLVEAARKDPRHDATERKLRLVI
jgi:site-specific recombinase XerD